MISRMPKSTSPRKGGKGSNSLTGSSPVKSNSDLAAQTKCDSSSESFGWEASRRGTLPSKYTFIEYNSYRFLITEAPSQFEIPGYIETLNKYKVKHVVRACEPTYESGELTTQGFKVHDWAFEDGGVPREGTVDDWLDLLDLVFNSDKQGSEGETVAVHCRSGLGRAPVLVCLAFIECGMEPIDAIGRIRIKRRGAISGKQVEELIRYRSRTKESKVQRGNPILSTASKIFGRRRRASVKLDRVTPPVMLVQ